MPRSDIDRGIFMCKSRMVPIKDFDDPPILAKNDPWRVVLRQLVVGSGLTGRLPEPVVIDLDLPKGLLTPRRREELRARTKPRTISRNTILGHHTGHALLVGDKLSRCPGNNPISRKIKVEGDVDHGFLATTTHLLNRRGITITSGKQNRANSKDRNPEAKTNNTHDNPSVGSP
jgi:hypothetical protein